MPVLELQSSTNPRSQSLVARLLDRLLPRLLDTDSPTALLLYAVSAAFFIRMVVVLLIYRSLPGSCPHFGGFGWELGWVAGSIANGHGFSSPFWPATGPTALVPPVFPYLLAGIFKIFGIYTLHAGVVILSLDSFFSALTCIPVYFIAKSAANARVAGLAAWGWVVYPFSVYYSTVIWEWSLTALLFTTCLAILLRLHKIHRTWIWLGFGALYGFTALVNPAILSVLPVLLFLAIRRRHRAALPWRTKTLVALVALFAVLAPWAMHVSRQMGKPVPIRDNFWLEFYAGNSGDSFESNVRWAHPASNPAEMSEYQRMGEIRYIAEKHRLAVEFVSHHPLWFAIATVRRFIRYWTGFWSFSPSYLRLEPLDLPNFFFCTGVTIMMLRGVRRLWTQRREAALPFAALIACFPVTYYLTHASMDYRQPIEPIIVILAIIGIFGVAPRVRESSPELELAVNVA